MVMRYVDGDINVDGIAITAKEYSSTLIYVHDIKTLPFAPFPSS
jgi:hypothetical protein